MTTDIDPKILQRIEGEIKDNAVVLFMKGTADMPVCGFSAAVVQILNNLQVPFRDINVLTDEEMRQGIKAYSNWPTIPQLYIRGEFIGGCDIAREMYKTGELQQKVLTK